MTARSVEEMWAPFRVSIHVGELTLRVLRDSDIAAIHGVTAAEIFGEPLPDYTFPWLKQKPDQVSGGRTARRCPRKNGRSTSECILMVKS